MSDIHTRWKAINGDDTLALDWPIGKDSHVWEIGGFEGRWAGQMMEKFDCHIEIFEPQLWAVGRMEERFRYSGKVEIHPFGLWVMDAVLPLYKFETDGASLMEASARSQLCTFVDAFQWVRNRPPVDVCLMNVEGAEFVLLPYMLGFELMKNFRYFWCQFHPGLVSDGDERANEIFKGMLRTHKKLWDHYPTAVAWERKE